MKKVACYVRVSTDNQIENYSIDEQTQRLKAYCAAKDYSIYRVYTDGGYSGGNTNRPALQSMLDDVRNGKVDAVLVYKLDRLSRSQKDTLSIIEDHLLKNGVDFISMSENFDTSSPFGKAMIGILSVFAQLEKDQITERFTMGRIGRSKAGLFHGGGNAPKGYDYIDGKLVVNPLQAKYVQEIYDLFLSGQSINAISKKMSVYSAAWSNSSQVLSTLKNKIYIGIVKFKGVEYAGVHEAIINKDKFDQVQSILSSSKREEKKTTAQKNPFRAGYLLSGLIFCKNCGARYSANHGYYKCYSRSKSSRQFVKDPNCKNRNWLIADLDQVVINEIHNAAPDTAYKLLSAEKNKQYKPEADKLRAEIKKIDNQILKLIDLYQLSDIPVAAIKSKIEALSEKKQEIQKILSVPRTDKLKEFQKNLNKFFLIEKTSGIEEKRLVIASLVEKVIIDEGQASIRWRI